MYVEVDNPLPLLWLPRGPPASNSWWTKTPVLRVAWSSVLGRFDSLRQLGLTSTMVATYFFRHGLAPLRAHPNPAWFYTGDIDASQLGHGSEFSPDAMTVV